MRQRRRWNCRRARGIWRLCTALRPEEIDTAAAERELEDGQKMWQEAGDDAAKYDYANAQMREAEEKLASAEGTS